MRDYPRHLDINLVLEMHSTYTAALILHVILTLQPLNDNQDIAVVIIVSLVTTAKYTQLVSTSCCNFGQECIGCCPCFLVVNAKCCNPANLRDTCCPRGAPPRCYPNRLDRPLSFPSLKICICLGNYSLASSFRGIHSFIFYS
jgi:hypothetical protein